MFRRLFASVPAVVASSLLAIAIFGARPASSTRPIFRVRPTVAAVAGQPRSGAGVALATGPSTTSTDAPPSTTEAVLDRLARPTTTTPTSAAIPAPSSVPSTAARGNGTAAPRATALACCVLSPVHPRPSSRAIRKTTPIARFTRAASNRAQVSRPTARPSSIPPATSASDGWQQITELEIPRIGLRSSVVLAPLVHEDGDTTWAVPAFRVGHAEYTAGAGDVGNAVLIGHVSSVDAGSVFHDLYLLRPGDSIRVWSGSKSVTYVVAGSSIVSRDDVSVIAWSPHRALTLITCAGAWIPALDDYATRLVIRAIAS